MSRKRHIYPSYAPNTTCCPRNGLTFTVTIFYVGIRSAQAQQRHSKPETQNDERITFPFHPEPHADHGQPETCADLDRAGGWVVAARLGRPQCFCAGAGVVVPGRRSGPASCRSPGHPVARRLRSGLSAPRRGARPGQTPGACRHGPSGPRLRSSPPSVSGTSARMRWHRPQAHSRTRRRQ